MKTLAFILCSLLTTILLSNCGEQKITCDPDSHKYYYVKPEEKAVLPFKGFDTLKLKHNSGEIHTFYAGAIDSFFNIITKSTSPDCANNIFEHEERNRLEFKALSFTNSIELSLGRTHLSGGANLQIKFKDNIVFFTLPYSDFSNNTKYDYDSIVIQDVQYTKVKVIYPFPNKPNNRLLYNKTYGIIRFEYSDGETFERIP